MSKYIRDVTRTRELREPRVRGKQNIAEGEKASIAWPRNWKVSCSFNEFVIGKSNWSPRNRSNV